MLLLTLLLTLFTTCCLARETAPYAGQLRFRPQEADLEWFYSRGIIDAPIGTHQKKPVIKWNARLNSITAFTTHQYASINFLDPVFLWPLQKQLFLGGDALNQPRTDFAMTLPSVSMAVKDMCFMGADTELEIEGGFGGLTIIGGALAYGRAFMTFKWPETTVIVGQTFHPAAEEKTIPHLVDINNGTPIVPILAFTPQIKASHTFTDATVTAALYTNSMFDDNGPVGFDSIYQRRGSLPGIDLRFGTNDPDRMFAVGFDVHRIVPQLFAPAPVFSDPLIRNTQVTAHLWNIFYYALAHYKQDKTTWRMQAMYGDNGTSLFLLGGYGVSNFNPVSGALSFTPLKFVTGWIDVEHELYNGKIKPGLFAGIVTSLGTHDPLALVNINDVERIVVYTIDDVTDDPVANPILNLKQLLRISPRFWITTKKHFQIGAELTYVRALFGQYQTNGSIPTLQTVPVLRFSIGTVISL